MLWRGTTEAKETLQLLPNAAARGLPQRQRSVLGPPAFLRQKIPSWVEGPAGLQLLQRQHKAAYLPCCFSTLSLTALLQCMQLLLLLQCIQLLLPLQRV